MKTCTQTGECSQISNFPSKCNIYPGLPQGFCNVKECGNDTECAQLPGYGCYEYGMCKPSYGPCQNTCDCLVNYNLIKGEGICYNQKCFCRTDGITDCTTAVKPTEPPTEPPHDVAHGEYTTAPPPPPYHPPSNGCPVTDNMQLGLEGSPCRVHQGCSPFHKLVCVKPAGQDVGVCQKITCSADGDCTSKSTLPTRCLGTTCSAKPCDLDGDIAACPPGYGCSGDGHCRKIQGKCEYDCDCGSCPDTACFKEMCFCLNDFDVCMSGSELPPAVSSGVAPPVVKYDPPPPPNDTCKKTKCPDGWQETETGCYKMGNSKLTFQQAVDDCTSQKGFLADILSMHDNSEVITKIVQGNEAWLGGKRKGDTGFTWVSGDNFVWQPVNWDKSQGGDCLKLRVGLWTNCDCSDAVVPLCETKRIDA